MIPDLCHDMHDCSVATGDTWLRAHIGGYADWAMTHDSLLIVSWDEDDGSPGNHITTIFAGQKVRPGSYSDPITHYSVLATKTSPKRNRASDYRSLANRNPDSEGQWPGDSRARALGRVPG